MKGRFSLRLILKKKINQALARLAMCILKHLLNLKRDNLPDHYSGKYNTQVCFLQRIKRLEYSNVVKGEVCSKSPHWVFFNYFFLAPFLVLWLFGQLFNKGTYLSPTWRLYLTFAFMSLFPVSCLRTMDLPQDFCCNLHLTHIQSCCPFMRVAFGGHNQKGKPGKPPLPVKATSCPTEG